MKTILFISLQLAIIATVFAASAGTTGFELLRTDGWARNAALGGSQIAFSGDIHSLYSNPAGLEDLKHPQAAVGFFKHVMDINAGNLAYAQPVKNIGVAGIGITYFDYGTFDRANEYGQKQGEFGASDFLLSASLARPLYKTLAGGIVLKYLNSSIDSYTASALAADLGFQYHTGYFGWDVGAGIYNMGFATSAFLEHKDDLPTAYRLGLSVPLQHLPARFSFAGEYMEAEGIRGCGGLELTFSKYLQARLGYNTIGIDQRTGLDSDALAGFSAGIGIHVKSISFDYAMTSQGEIGYLHRFTIGTIIPGKGIGN